LNPTQFDDRSCLESACAGLGNLSMTDSSQATPEVRIRVRADGPLVVEGPVRLVDSSGKPYPLPPSGKSNLALCRCGASQHKPFCDGQHKSIDFRAADPAPDPRDK